MNKPIIALIKIEPKKILDLGIDVSDIKYQINLLKEYAEVSHYDSLEELALRNGISTELIKPTVPKEVEPIVEYIQNVLEVKTKDLKEEVDFYKNIVKDIKNQLVNLKEGI